jgi:Rps23 Pro-64 3,4-dihydroxylase Tpa1-like proline 4-hydroxylase
MLKGQQGGDFAPNGYQHTIDEEFITSTSQFSPRTNEVHPIIPNDTRQRRDLKMNPDMETDQGNFNVSLSNSEFYREQWEQNKSVNITNLFPELQANTIHNYYFNQPDDWWDLILYPDPDFDYEQAAIDNPGYYHMYKAKLEDPSLSKREEYCRKLNNEGAFSYIYRRKNSMDDLHPYLKIFQDSRFREYLSKITGYSDLEYAPGSTFISNYGPGHYNGPHTDGINGRIAFVFHLSKDWKPEMGGLFMRMDWDWETVNKVICPPFNTLSIFDTKWQGQDGSPHLVSEIAQGVTNKRISYTGWYY